MNTYSTVRAELLGVLKIGNNVKEISEQGRFWILFESIQQVSVSLQQNKSKEFQHLGIKNGSLIWIYFQCILSASKCLKTKQLGLHKGSFKLSRAREQHHLALECVYDEQLLHEQVCQTHTWDKKHFSLKVRKENAFILMVQVTCSYFSYHK